MGYPMTWKRVVSRNGLRDAEVVQMRWAANVNCALQSDDSLAVSRARAERVNGLSAYGQLLAGDLRRLEHDATDENTICRLIAGSTGIDADDVAAVLSAFFEMP